MWVIPAPPTDGGTLSVTLLDGTVVELTKDDFPLKFAAFRKRDNGQK
jgi:hypothetical protein